jgi:hypothetical protein
MNKTLINPTDKDVTIVIKGDIFTIEADSKESFPANIVDEWVRTHEFLKVEKESVKEEKEEIKKEEKVKKTK